MRLMRLVLIAAALTMVSLGTADAQLPFRLGLKGGLNSANVEGDDAGAWGSRRGMVAGIFASLKLPAGLSLQPELLYSQKGAKGTLRGDSTTVNATLKTAYIEIPVLLKYALSSKGPVTPCLFAGPAFAFSKSSKTELETSVLGLPLSGDVDNYNEKSTDFGLVFGGSLDFSAGPSLLTLDVRYTLGTSTMWDKVTLPVPRDQLAYRNASGGPADMKNAVLSITAGMMF